MNLYFYDVPIPNTLYQGVQIQTWFEKCIVKNKCLNLVRNSFFQPMFSKEYLSNISTNSLLRASISFSSNDKLWRQKVDINTFEIVNESSFVIFIEFFNQKSKQNYLSLSNFIISGILLKFSNCIMYQIIINLSPNSCWHTQLVKR